MDPDEPRPVGYFSMEDVETEELPTEVLPTEVVEMAATICAIAISTATVDNRLGMWGDIARRVMQIEGLTDSEWLPNLAFDFALSLVNKAEQAGGFAAEALIRTGVVTP